MYRNGLLLIVSLISSWAHAAEFNYSETVLEQELREQIACLSLGTCTPDISGYYEEGTLTNEELGKPFFEFDRQAVVASVQLTATLNVFSADHHIYEDCSSLNKVLEKELLKTSGVSLSSISCVAGLGYSAGTYLASSVEPVSLLAKQLCQGGACPTSFYYGSNFFTEGDYFPYSLSVTYRAVATPVKKTDLELVFNVEIYADYNTNTLLGEIFLIDSIAQAADSSLYNEIAENFTGSFTDYENIQNWEAESTEFGPVDITQNTFSTCVEAIEVLQTENPSLLESVTGYQCESSSSDALSLPSGSGELESVTVAPIVGHQACENANCPPGYSEGQVFKVLVDTSKILVIKANADTSSTARLSANYRTIYKVRAADFRNDYQWMMASLPLGPYQHFREVMGGSFAISGSANGYWGGDDSKKSSIGGGQSISISASSPMRLGCDALQYSDHVIGNRGQLIVNAEVINQLLAQCDKIEVQALYVQSLSSDEYAADISVSAIKLEDEIEIWQRYGDLLADNMLQRYDIYQNFSNLQSINYADTVAVSSYMVSLSQDIWTQLELFLGIAKEMSSAQISAEYNALYYTSGDLMGILQYATGAIEKPEYWDEFIYSPFSSGTTILDKVSAIKTLYAALIDDSIDQTPTREIFVSLTNEAKSLLLNEVNKANWFLTEYVAKAQTDIKDQLNDIQVTIQTQLDSIFL